MMPATFESAPATDSEERVFQVLLGNRLSVEASLMALSKRCARKGLASPVWSWGQPTSRIEHVEQGECIRPAPCGGCRKITRVPLTLHAERAHFAGWTFAAALTHLEGENLVRSLSKDELPKTYRTRGPVCDHCKAARRRSETYVLRHEDGPTVQVGSTCIADFLGSEDAAKIAALATHLASFYSAAEEGCEGFGGNSSEQSLEGYLPAVAWSVRVFGWKSRTVVREQGGQATADHALQMLTNREEAKRCEFEPTDADVALADEAIEWAEALTDAQVDAETGDYLHNLRAVARSGLCSTKSMGIAASMITAYQRFIGRERQRAERAARPKLDAHLGAVGEKLTFGIPQQVGKRGKPLKNAPTVASLSPVVLDFVTGYDTDFGHITVLKFRTAEGACIVWKASNTEIDRSCVGKAYTLWGAVKKHDEYKGEKQTVLTRCAVNEVVA